MRSRTPGTSASTASRRCRSATRHAVRTPHSAASAAAASAGSVVLACSTTSAPALRERARHRRAEPARGAGDERDASGEIEVRARRGSGGHRSEYYSSMDSFLRDDA